MRDKASHLGLRLAPDTALPCLQDIDTLQVALGSWQARAAGCLLADSAAVQDLQEWHQAALASGGTINPAAQAFAQQLLQRR